MIPDRYDLIKYYSNHFNPDLLKRIIKLEPFDTREFAFKYTAASDSIGRPVCFDDLQSLKDYLGTHGPNKAYVGGFYGRKFPTDKKLQALVRANEWLGRELCWDIDMDQYTNVRKHLCECGMFKTVCNKCLELAKEAVTFLVDTLKYDFGLDKEKFVNLFSGRQGFHVWIPQVTSIFDNTLLNLPPGIVTKMETDMRSAIAEYLNLVTEKQRRRTIKGEIETEHIISVNCDALPITLRKRLYNQTFKNLVLKSPPETLKEIKGVKKTLWEKIKTDLQDNSGSEVYMKYFSQLTPVKSTKLKEQIIELRYPRFDVGCTKDIQRIMKIPGAVDGSTGNVCIIVEDLEKFSLEDVPNIETFLEN